MATLPATTNELDQNRHGGVHFRTTGVNVKLPALFYWSCG
jgi:hypothetical protein